MLRVKVVSLDVPDHHPNITTDLLNQPVDVLSHFLKFRCSIRTKMNSFQLFLF